MKGRGEALAFTLVLAAGLGARAEAGDDSVAGPPVEPGGTPPEEEAAVPGELPRGWVVRGDTQLGPPERFDIALGLQYRLMYNASNLPGPAGSTIDDTEDYDFFRQRLRLNLGLAPRGIPAGGVAQIEFRGGFGGSSPNVSDARDAEPTLNPFNRLQARGLRYGYLYVEPFEDQMFLGGLLPFSDETADTLFSADWDFNVGGVGFLGSCGPARYRLAYLRLVESVGTDDPRRVDEDGTFLLADLEWDFGRPLAAVDSVRGGLHGYFLDVPDGLPLGATEELWGGPTIEIERRGTSLSCFALFNAGRLGQGVLDDAGRVVSGFEEGDGHTGWAFRAELARDFEVFETRAQVLYATGDGGGVEHRFVTPQGLLGTEGYWAYTHIFTANPPSDVNDLAIDLGNGGAGLLSLQGKLRVPLWSGHALEVFAGWFRSDRERNGSRDVGTEIGALLEIAAGAGVTWSVGAAGAFPGGFFADDPDALYEVFSRLQFHF